MQAKVPARIAIPDLQMKIAAAGKKPVIVDVRSPREIQESGAVPGAVHLPMDQIEGRIGEFSGTSEVIFYCGGGGRASRAAQALWDAGHRNVFYFGLRDWKRRNLPVVKTAKPM